MVSMLSSGSRGPDPSHGCGRCVMFQGKTQISYCASLSDGLASYQTPVFSWNRNRAKLQPDVALGSYADFPFNIQLSVKAYLCSFLSHSHRGCLTHFPKQRLVIAFSLRLV